MVTRYHVVDRSSIKANLRGRGRSSGVAWYPLGQTLIMDLAFDHNDLLRSFAAGEGFIA